MKAHLLAGALLVAGASEIASAHADPPATPRVAVDSAAAVPEPCSRLGRSAFRWSLGSTVVPAIAGGVWAATQSNSDDRGPGIVVATTGVMLGPAVGYMVGGCPGRGLGGFGIRTAIAVVSGVAGYFVIGASDDFGESSTNYATQNLGVAILVAGGLGIAASTVYDVSHVGRTVRERCTAAHAARWQVTPVMLAGGRTHAPGIAVHVSLGS